MLAGRLATKGNLYYIVLSYNKNGKRKEKWFSTGLSISGSKKKIEKMLFEYRSTFDPITEKFPDDNTLNLNENIEATPPQIQEASLEPIVQKAEIATKLSPSVSPKIMNEENCILFVDYLLTWLEKHKKNIAEITYIGYKKVLKNQICPYFKEKEIALHELTADDLEEFYDVCLEKVSANTIKHYHANIRKALQIAYVKGMILNNVADKVTLPKIDPYIGNYYNSDELLELFDCVKGDKIELAVFMASYYGLRRSEIVGLKWDAIDFTYKTITIKHTVTVASLDGKEQIIASDRGKTKKSYRTLPLLPEFEKILNDFRKQTEANKAFAGEAYSNEFSEYIYVDELGRLIKPNYISQHYKLLLEINNLKRIRFHDLRHSCATLLRHEGVPMEDIQKWLGHSNLTTTEKIYAHFEDERHWISANRIADKLSRKKERDFEM